MRRVAATGGLFALDDLDAAAEDRPCREVRWVVAELERTPAFVRPRFGIAERCYLTSFDTSVLEDCRRHATEISRLVSVNAAWAEKQGGLAAFLERVEGLAELVAIHQDLMEAEWELIRSRLPLERLCVWTVNEEAAMRHWLSRGIGSLTTDSPNLALTLRTAMAA